MRLWRISSFADLSGEGGLLAAGRWHSRGRRIVYLADHSASALLEVLVHLEVDMDDLPSAYRLHAADVDDAVSFDALDEKSLPADWRDSPDVTRAAGDKWVAENRTLLLRVPSAIVPFASNWLLNPRHADSAKARIVDSIHLPYDLRLLR
jgi:RES domain-containing protein